VLTSALAALERLLLPNSCVACGRGVGPREPDSLVCPPCRSRLRPLTAGCDRCGQPLPPVGPCRFCRDWPVSLDHAASAVWLGAEARALIHHLKYEGYTRLSDDIAQIIARVVEHPGASVLAPIPLGARRMRQRGFNQAKAIARSLGRVWRVPVDAAVLARVRETKTQTALTPAERAENVAGAFAAAPPPLNQGRVILIDDVLTTGATLAAAAAALHDAGWRCVGAVTFARALPFVVRLESA
jgi:ComF family protein